MAMPSKLRRYTNEVRHCWRLGAGFSDRASLAIDTLSFHAQNAIGRLSCSETEAVQHCRIRLPRWGSAIDFYYRVRGGDLFILHEVLLDRCYWIPPRLANSVKNVVDLGGNIGTATLSFATQFPEASFVCAEPNPGNATVLARNVAWLGSRARVAQVAIGDYDGEAEFKAACAAWGGQLGGGQGSIRVQCHRLDTFLDSMDLDRVDVLKVDIEGAERGVFASRGDWWKKVQLIIAELHSPYSFQHFESDMRAIGLRAIAAGSEHGNLLPIAIRA